MKNHLWRSVPTLLTFVMFGLSSAAYAGTGSTTTDPSLDPSLARCKKGSTSERLDCISDAIEALHKELRSGTAGLQADLKSTKADLEKKMGDATTQLETAIGNLRNENRECCNRLAQAVKNLKDEVEKLKGELEKQTLPRVEKACTSFIREKEVEGGRKVLEGARFYYIHKDATWQDCERITHDTVHRQGRTSFHCVRFGGPVEEGQPIEGHMPSLQTPYITTGRVSKSLIGGWVPNDMLPEGPKNFCGWKP